LRLLSLQLVLREEGSLSGKLSAPLERVNFMHFVKIRVRKETKEAICIWLGYSDHPLKILFLSGRALMSGSQKTTIRHVIEVGGDGHFPCVMSSLR
jgi:hypothetical protein